MITILGAGGVISNELVALLAERHPLRLVGRRARPAQDATEVLSADLADKEQTIRAVAGSTVVYLLAGLKYDRKVWAETWPKIMSNTIEGCKRTGARLVFFDNVYAYGKVNGAMTEETRYNPCSKKGEVRAKIAMSLANEWKTGNLTAMIARCADFYGPNAPNGVPNVLIFEPFSQNHRASCLASDAMSHSYTYIKDAARGLVALADDVSAWNQTWHLPTAQNPPTGKEFIDSVAKAFGVPPKYRVLTTAMVRLIGWFKPLVGEVYEMLYQNDSPYLFDSSKFANAFGFSGTPYAEGIAATAASFKSPTLPNKSKAA